MEGQLRLTDQSHLSLTHLGGWTPMEGHLRLTDHSHLSPTHLGGWTPMEGHLRLTGQSHFFLQIYVIPQILLKSRLLIGRELQMLASDWSRGSVENDQRGTPLRYGGTFEIDRSISIVPETLRRLDTYWGTFEIDRSISFVRATLRRLDTY